MKALRLSLFSNDFQDTSLHSVNLADPDWVPSSGRHVGAEASQSQEVRPAPANAARRNHSGSEALERLRGSLSTWHQLRPFCQQNIPDGVVSRGNSRDWVLRGEGKKRIWQKRRFEGLFVRAPRIRYKIMNCHQMLSANCWFVSEHREEGQETVIFATCLGASLFPG